MCVAQTLCVLLSACAGCAWGSSPPELNRDNVAAFFDAAFAVQQKDHEIVGAVVSVVYRGEVLFLGGYGYADLEKRIPADPSVSLFRIASISKPFVWTSVMQLVEQGRLSLDDPIDAHLDFPVPDTFDEPIRVRHLMTHTPGFEEKGVGGSVRSTDELVPLGEHLAQSTPARVRPPGVHASYSNYGTALAGYIVERISGQLWSDYVDAHILGPLKMTSTNTQPVMSEALAERHARGYKYSGGRFLPTDYVYLLDVPAGHLSTTAEDMTRFMLAHLNDGVLEDGRILSAETTRQMRSPLFAPHEAIQPILHGFFRTDRSGLEIFGHGGDTNQFHSNLSLVPQHELGVFVSFNSDPAADARSRLVPAFFDHFFAGEYLREAPKAIELDLEPYAGEYLSLRRNQSTFERLSQLVASLMISVQGSELVLSAGTTSRWLAVAEDQFAGRYADGALVFRRDAAGAVSHLQINSPLGTYERVRGLDAPSNQRFVLGGIFLIAIVTVLGYGYRIWQRAPESSRLPALHAFAAWLFALMTLALYAYLFVTLNSDVEEFQFGVPPAAGVLLTLMPVNAILGAVVMFFSTWQWVQGLAGAAVRFRYSLVALAALMNLWFCWYFRIFAYLFG